MNTRRQALVLAAILSATALTGAFAAAGITHRSTARTPAPIVQLAPARAASPASTWADD
jgi:hypothetical protein